MTHPGGGRVSPISPTLPRDQFPVADRFRYLDHAGASAPPTVVAHAVARDASAATMLGTTGDRRRADRLEQVRGALAALLGSSPPDLAFLRNAVEAHRLLAFGLPWKPGEAAVLVGLDSAPVLAPWSTLSARGVEVLTVAAQDGSPDRLETLLAAHPERVRAVVAGWVHPGTGRRLDLHGIAEVAHRHGASAIADLSHGAGVLPVDLRASGLDAALTETHRWLLGPEGVAALHITPGLRRHLWATARDDLGTPATASLPLMDRFEAGTPNRLGLAGLGAATELLGGVDPAAVWQQVDRWCGALELGLADLGGRVSAGSDPEQRSAIVSVRFGRPGAELVEELVPHGVVASSHGDLLRFSPHGWNDEEDLLRTLQALARCQLR